MSSYKRQVLKESKGDIRKLWNLMEDLIEGDEVVEWRDSLIIANSTNWKQKDIQAVLGVSRSTISRLNLNNTLAGYWKMIDSHSPKYRDVFKEYVLELAYRERTEATEILDQKPIYKVA